MTREIEVITVGEPNMEIISKTYQFHQLISTMYREMMEFFQTEEGMREFEEWKAKKEKEKENEID